MGKKGRKNKPEAATAASATNSPAVAESIQLSPTAPTSTAAAAPIFYPSDGPSDVELLQTSSPSLQAKLDQLTVLAQADDRAQFVRQFVPVDVSQEDGAGFLSDLTSGPESEGQWRNLASEIAAIARGRGVDRIEGGQVTRAVFFFQHPIHVDCDREVAFICVNGEWRAEG